MPTNRQSKQVFFFDDSRLSIYRKNQLVFELVVWPNPQARERDKIGNWQRASPEFRFINHPPPQATQDENLPQLDFGLAVEPASRRGLCSKKEAYNELRKTIPEPYATRLAPFRSHQWSPLVFLSIDEKFAELLESTPALAYYLANRNGIRSRVFLGMMLIEDLIRKPQAQLAGILSLPEKKGTVKLLRKFSPESVTLDNLALFKKVVRSQELLSAAAHLQTINTGTLHLLCHRERFRDYLTPQLLEEVSQDQSSRFSRFACQLLDETVTRFGDLHAPPRQPPRIRSLEQLHNLHMEVMNAYAEQRRARMRGPLPAPPVEGNNDIVPLRSGEELAEEGKQQHNCVGGYTDSVRSGRTYIYSVKSPERATLSIVKRPNGHWQVGSLLAAYNKPVQPCTVDAVEEWLESDQMGI